MQLIESATEIKERATDWFDSVTEYAEARWNLGVLELSEKAAKSVSNFASALIIGIIGGLMMFFMSLGLAWYIGQKLDNMPLGFVIVGFIYGLIGVVLYTIRERFIKLPIINTFIKNFYYEK
ncbi:MAG: phage holin family protein [Emticicia sp.]|uniref:phage holin family protein n=1 Tax=Emticicia sp. TaxID=1930953 RepID=UPI003BA6E048